EAPTFDPLPDQTSHAELLLAGHAEPGAKIALSRTPDFPREYKVPAIVADPVTARWSAVVPLAENVLNKFTAKATDEAGLTSPEAAPGVSNDLAPRDSVAFEVLPGEPATATLTLSAGGGISGSSITVAAGTECKARVVAKDSAGNVVLAPWVLTTAPANAFIT